MKQDERESEGRDFANKMFSAGVRAVLRTVFCNAMLRETGITADLTDDEQQAVRYLRYRINGQHDSAKDMGFAWPPKKPAMCGQLRTITRKIAKRIATPPAGGRDGE